MALLAGDHGRCMKALIICTGFELACTLPCLLAKSGFSVDILSKSGMFKGGAFVESVFLVPAQESVAAHALRLVQEWEKAYNWIIVTEDGLLLEILRQDAPDDLKLKILPVTAARHFSHLYSKIGLAEVLERNGIPHPKFKTARTPEEAERAAEALGYPVMLKIDSSNGGAGTYECNTSHDLRRYQSPFNGNPMLLQEKVGGALVDLSAIYFEGNLVHFTYSIIHKSKGPFGPSIVRDYLPVEAIDRDVARELQNLGLALGAHGFANISAIETGNRRYYFEADLRPNVWIGVSTFFGDDPAEKIKNWFTNKTFMRADDLTSAAHPVPFTRIPYFLRMSNLELVANRYNVWHYIPFGDSRMVLRLLARKFALDHLFRLGRFFTPKRFRQDIKNFLAKSGIF